ncbi:MAG: formimidoylglutamate deiminase [Bacteriovoracaceae bacterium]|jgi:formimidoylglutamate deiminase
MKVYRFDNILLKSGWTEEIYITVDDEKIIQRIDTSLPDEEIFPKEGYLIPGFQNAHSHAFQYSMAGLNEGLSPEAKSDDFWSWRENMYAIALKISPEELEQVATDLYIEMIRHGYTHVAEFHYLHHDFEGNPYENLSEMSDRLMNASVAAGISLTIIPMFYQVGGFNSEAGPKQRRFISQTVDEYLNLFNEVQKASQNYNNVNVGIGVHSLRAVKPEDIISLFKKAPADIPKHLHISEQVQEVQDCVSHLGKRPVEWLLENVNLDENFHLVHATHINSEELDGLIKTKANVVLCPSTEGNLGDGLFPLLEFYKKGGKFSIGTDSHIGLSPMEELRWLDYTVRLIEKSRNPLCLNAGDLSGDILYHMAYQTGLKAMGIEQEDYFEVGKKLKGYLITKDNSLFKNKPLEHVLGTLIYSAGPEHLERLI